MGVGARRGGFRATHALTAEAGVSCRTLIVIVLPCALVGGGENVTAVGRSPGCVCTWHAVGPRFLRQRYDTRCGGYFRDGQLLTDLASVLAAGTNRPGDIAMLKYVILVNWTEQGARSVPETTQRAEHVRQMIAQMGGRMDTLLWTQGRYDLVGIVEAPDEETAAAVGLRIAMRGAVRTETLRAYDAEEMGRILTKVS
jgi:uncharacterized protein with GYD domain